MLFEVHSSARPGKPRALVTVTAVLLASTLGLAWLQVHGARTMGPEQRIPGTPLLIRPPQGWRLDTRTPVALAAVSALARYFGAHPQVAGLLKAARDHSDPKIRLAARMGLA